MMENKVVVMGADHHNALGIVRSMARKGMSVDAILIGEVSDGFVLKSKYIREGKRFNTPGEAVDYLIKRYEDEKTIVLTASDDIAVELDSAYHKLTDNIIIPNAKGKLSYWISKQSMCKLAEEVGLTVPKHVVYQTGDNLPSGILFPCITKAISSIDGTKSDTHICQTKEALLADISTEQTCHTLIIEQFIEKSFEFQFLGLSLNAGETIIIPGHSHIVWHDIENTNYFPYMENDSSFTDTLSKTKEFIKATGYSGLFSVEFLRGKDGIDYFLEMNFRNDGNAICVTDAGYNLPYIWYLYNSGGDYLKYINECNFTSVKYCPEFVCTYQMLGGELDLRSWWSMIRHSDSYTIYCPGDNAPFWYNLKLDFKGMIATFLKRFHRK